MTATPERSDDFDIYALFHHHIAYEIRLHDALEENMLVPFHYHGISEITVDGKVLDDMSDFALLTCEERVKHILYYAGLYGSDADRIKGLVFCRNVDEAKLLVIWRRRRQKTRSISTIFLLVIFSMKASTFLRSIRSSCCVRRRRRSSLSSS